MGVLERSSVINNIIAEELKPRTFGEFIDALIIINIRMWHEQEIIYEIETLKKMKKKDMFEFLKRATWLNLQRNFSIDKLDGILEDKLMELYPDCKQKDKPTFMDEQKLIWEQI